MWQAVNSERLVPQNHILRHIDRVVDLPLLRPLEADLYHSQLGRPSYPPELILLIFLLSDLRNLADVRVCEEVKVRRRWGQARVSTRSRAGWCSSVSMQDWCGDSAWVSMAPR